MTLGFLPIERRDILQCTKKNILLPLRGLCFNSFPCCSVKAEHINLVFVRFGEMGRRGEVSIRAIYFLAPRLSRRSKRSAICYLPLLQKKKLAAEFLFHQSSCCGPPKSWAPARWLRPLLRYDTIRYMMQYVSQKKAIENSL